MAAAKQEVVLCARSAVAGIGRSTRRHEEPRLPQSGPPQTPTESTYRFFAFQPAIERSESTRAARGSQGPRERACRGVRGAKPPDQKKNLNTSSIVRAVLTVDRDQAERVRRVDVARGRTEARMVEQVEGLGAELEVAWAADAELLRQHGVDVLVAGRAGDADAAVAERAPGARGRRPRCRASG